MSVLLILSSLSGVFVFAENSSTTPRIVVSNETIYADGEPVEVTISLENNPGIASVNLVIEYSNEYLTLVEVTDHKVISGFMGNTLNTGKLTWWNFMGDNITENGKIATLKFEVSDNAPIDVPFEVSVSYDSTKKDITDANGKSVEFTIVDGSITVVEKPKTPLTGNFTFEDKTVTYDGNAHSLVMTYDGADGVTVDPSEIIYTYAKDGVPVDEVKDAGIYEVTATVNKSGYTAEPQTATLVINPASLTITGYDVAENSKKMQYTGAGVKDVALTAGTVTGIVDDAKIVFPEKGTITVDDIGFYDVTAASLAFEKEADSANYTFTQPPLSQVEVTKAPITITIGNSTKVLNDEEPTFTYEVTSGEVYDGDTIQGTPERVDTTEQIGDYEITEGDIRILEINGDILGKESPNYDITFVNGKLTITEHVHKWTFTANEETNTITAKCKGEGPCTVTGRTATITLSAPENLVYDGNSKDAALTGSIDGVKPEIVYSEENRVDVGNYTASVTLGDAVAKVTYIITPAPLTITPVDVSKVYGTQGDPDLKWEITNGRLYGNDEIVVTLKRAEGDDVNEYAISVEKYTFTSGDEKNYTVTTETGKFTISTHVHNWTYTADGATINAVCDGEGPCTANNKGSITLKAPANQVYNGASKDVTLEGSIDNGETNPEIVYFAANRRNVGDYTASITVGGKTASIKYTITPAPYTVTLTSAEKVYGEEDPALTYTTEGTLYQPDTLGGNPEREAGEDVNTYKITKGTLSINDGNEGKNYTLTVNEATFTIKAHKHEWKYTLDGTTINAKCEGDGTCDVEDGISSITLNAPENLEYNGQSKDAYIDGEINGVTPVIVYEAGNRVDVGNYTASVTLGDAVATVQYAVTPAPLTIKLNDVQINDGEAIPGSDELSYTIENGTLYGNDDLDITIVIEEDEDGYDLNHAYAITATYNNPNYSVTIENGTFTIVPVAVSGITVTPAAATMKDDETLTITAEVSPANASDKTVTWILPDGVAKVSESEDTFSIVIDPATAGEVTITAAAGGETATCVVTVEHGNILANTPWENDGEYHWQDCQCGEPHPASYAKHFDNDGWETGTVTVDGNETLIHYHTCDHPYCGVKYDIGAHTEESAANCENPAKCSVCGEFYGEEAPEVHTALKYVEAHEPNCVSGGSVAYYHCDGCGNNYKDAAGTVKLEQIDADKDPTNHTALKVVGEVKATCVSEGNIEYYYCDGCKNCYSDEEGLQKIPAESVITQKDASNHVNIKKADEVKATCTSTGSIEYYHCDDCNNNYKNATDSVALTEEQIIIPVNPVNHTDLKFVAADVPTCVAGGTVNHYYCSGCKNNYSDEAGTKVLDTTDAEINPDNHVGAAADAEWQHDGEKHWKLCQCDKPDPETVGDHTGGTATCKNEAKCSVCKTNYGNKADANHTNLVHVAAVDATCVKGGNNEYWYCSGCNKYFSDAAGTTVFKGDRIYGKTEHRNHATALVYEKPVAATCVAPGGVEYYHCNSCNNNYSDPEGTLVLTNITEGIDKDYHPGFKYVAEVAATCAEYGKKAYYECSGCHKKFEDESAAVEITDLTLPIDGENHSWGAWQKVIDKDTVDATVSHKVRTCAACGATDEKEFITTYKIKVAEAVDKKGEEVKVNVLGGTSSDTEDIVVVVDTDALAEAMDNHVEDTEHHTVVVDVTHLLEHEEITVKEINSVTIPQAAVENLHEAVDTHDDLTHTEINLSEGSIRLNKKALSTIASIAGQNDNADFVLDIDTVEETEPQAVVETLMNDFFANSPAAQKVLEELTTVTENNGENTEENSGSTEETTSTPVQILGAVDVTMTGGEQISVLSDEEVTDENIEDANGVGIDFRLPSGLKESGLAVYYIGDDGTVDKDVKFDFDSVNEKLWIYTTHFSVYAPVYDESLIPAEPETDDGDDDNTISEIEAAMIALRNHKFTITAAAGEGGSISNEGRNFVKFDSSITFEITPDEGYAIESVLVNGKDVGAVEEYTFKKVRKNQTIVASFVEIEDESSDVIDEAIDEESWANPFVDVAEDADYIDAIEFVYENGLFKGISDTEFAPEMTMTRGMFVTVLGRAAGVDTMYYTGTSFDDVVPGEWYAPYVEWAAEAGIVLGYGDGKFGVNDQITVEQAAVILARYAEYAGIYEAAAISLELFADADSVSDWALEAMMWAVENGIYTGEYGVLAPQALAPRALIAEMLYNLTKVFAD